MTTLPLTGEPRAPSLVDSTPMQSSQETLRLDSKQLDTTNISTECPLETPSAQSTSENTVWKHLTADIRPSLIAEIELILLTIFTGMQDAVSFPDYHCFTSNQTGNTVFLMLAIVIPRFNGEMFLTANIGCALGFFLLASCLTGQLGHIVGPRCRLWLIGCNLFQACLVFAAGAIQQVYGVQLEGTRALVVIGLLSFAAGSQVVQSRSMAMTEISTAMATAAWVDLVIDPKLAVLNNRPRTRRVVFLASLIVGALLGAVIYRNVGSSVVVLISAGGKALVALMYLFNEAEKPKVEAEKV